MLWIGSIFGWPKGGSLSQPALCILLAELDVLRDVVDIITVSGYYTADPTSGNMTNGGLLQMEGTVEVVQALKDAGWQKVHVLLGNVPEQYGGNNASVAVYKHYIHSDDFVRAIVNEVVQHSYDGINFDFELSDPAPVGGAECAAMSTFLSKVKASLIQKGRADVLVSVDTGQSGMAKTYCLNASLADQYISMNSYGDKLGFDRSMPRDVAAVGAERFGMGVCPVCSTNACRRPDCASNITNISERMAEAERLGVRHVDFWAGAKQPKWAFGHEWWGAIRKWKARSVVKSLR